MIKIEHLVIKPQIFYGEKDFERHLNEHGQYGWKFAGSEYGYLIFTRPKED